MSESSLFVPGTSVFSTSLSYEFIREEFSGCSSSCGFTDTLSSFIPERENCFEISSQKFVVLVPDLLRSAAVEFPRLEDSGVPEVLDSSRDTGHRGRIQYSIPTPDVSTDVLFTTAGEKEIP